MLHKPTLLTALYFPYRLLLYDPVRITSDFGGDFNDFFCRKLRPFSLCHQNPCIEKHNDKVALTSRYNRDDHQG